MSRSGIRAGFKYLANLTFAITDYLEEILHQLDGLLLGVCPKDGEPADEQGPIQRVGGVVVAGSITFGSEAFVAPTTKLETLTIEDHTQHTAITRPRETSRRKSRKPPLPSAPR